MSSNGEGRATPQQCRDIRIWLKLTGRSGAEVTAFYHVAQLEELASTEADTLIRRVMEMRRAN